MSMVFDPPSGWMYGFPAVVPEGINVRDDEELTKWLISKGYPTKDIPLALKHSRMWEFNPDKQKEESNFTKDRT